MKKFIKSRGFTDRLYFLNLILTWIFVWACFIVVILSSIFNISDMTVLSTAISCAFGELAVHTSLIVWKAKAENINKHKGLKEDIEYLDL